LAEGRPIALSVRKFPFPELTPIRLQHWYGGTCQATHRNDAFPDLIDNVPQGVAGQEATLIFLTIDIR
jgi:hypothetical protein